VKRHLLPEITKGSWRRHAWIIWGVATVLAGLGGLTWLAVIFASCYGRAGYIRFELQRERQEGRP
jgi:hypothetical protein